MPIHTQKVVDVEYKKNPQLSLDIWVGTDQELQNATCGTS